MPARQNGWFFAVPVWDDVRTFDGRPWRKLLTWFLAASRARTSISQVRVPASMAERSGLWRKWPTARLARYDPASCSWKTPQCSLFADSEPSLTWPPGFDAEWECWERIPSVANHKRERIWILATHHRPARGTRNCTMEQRKWDGVRPWRITQDSLSFAVAREEKAEGRHIPHDSWNPPWVGWIMGWPIRWTDLKPLAMDKFLVVAAALDRFSTHNAI